MKNYNLILAVMWLVTGILFLMKDEVPKFAYGLAIMVIVLDNLTDCIENRSE